ncbi:MAG: ABC transporter permease [Myxococcota bacterium]
MRSQPIEAVGLRVVGLLGQLGAFARFVAAIGRAVVVRPYRFARLVAEVFDIGVRSLAIICASGGVVGAVLALQGYYMLVRFGAEDALGTMVGLILVLELGPVLTALLTTGRAASAMAAEIASMVTTEQLDGLRMMSVDPIDFVVAPKAVAMVLVMPMLSALFIVCGIAGGYLVGVELLGLDGGSYLTSLEQSIDFADDVAQSLLKALVFGALAGFIATYRGYTAEPTAAGVSAATTGTVVVASVSVLMANYVITALWRAYGPPGGV